ncbi:MAG: hypothetical protein EOP81_14210 [Variovorax sp.]|nr:MAG: hypothetical protein EOP81_14210 [Variovorax sp.]
MTTTVRMALWLGWLGAAASLWSLGFIGTATAWAVGALSLAVFAWPGTTTRRRNRSLQYVEMGKQPVGSP